MELDCYNGSDELVPFPTIHLLVLTLLIVMEDMLIVTLLNSNIWRCNANELNAGLNLYQSIHSHNPFNGKQFLYKLKKE